MSNARLKFELAFCGPHNKASSKGRRERAMWRDFSRAVRELWRIPGENTGAYRPDLHYMRGPGPKWHAKHAGFVGTTPPASKPARPALNTIAERRA
jgi:hypothetical protein